MADDDERAARLAAVRAEALTCTRCDLWQTRRQVVFGVGDPNADLMIVGEGPGETEDKRGEPFVGRAGRLLDTLLAEAGLARGEVWLTNVVKSRPVAVQGERSANRAPRVGEIRACAPWLDAELDLVNPRVVLCLGATAAKRLIRPDFRLTDERGIVYDSGGRRLAATLHPAYVLRLQGEANAVARAQLLADLVTARTERDRLRAG